MMSKIIRLALGKILPPLIAASAGLICYVNLIITTDEVMSNEKYEPLKEYINRTFKTATHFGDVLILER